MVNNARTIVYYDTYINGERYRFSDEQKALEVAHQFGTNLFRCEDTLHWRPEDEPSGVEIRMVARTLNDNSVMRLDGDYFDIEKALCEALRDRTIRKIDIWIRHK